MPYVWDKSPALSVWNRGWSAGREAEWPLNGHVEEQRQLWYMTGEVDEWSEACQEQSEDVTDNDG